MYGIGGGGEAQWSAFIKKAKQLTKIVYISKYCFTIGLMSDILDNLTT
jgi:hypothetical protein